MTETRDPITAGDLLVGKAASSGASELKTQRVAVLVSGSGTNLQSLIDTWALQPKRAQLSLVLSNRPGIFALERAATANIPSCVLDHTKFGSRTAFDEALHEALESHQIDFIVLAGFMRILSPDFLTRWPGKIINIHPSLLPAYRGLNTHARALADGQKEHGCSIHWVEPELDAGPIIAQAKIDINHAETAEQLQQRVQRLEHMLYPLALHTILSSWELSPSQPVSSLDTRLGAITENELQKRYNDWRHPEAL